MKVKRLNTTRTTIVALMSGMSAIAATAADPYVESQGHAGISTGYCMTTNSRVEVDFAMTMLDSTTVGSRVFGVEDADGKGGMVLSVYMPGNNQKFAFRIGNGWNNKKEYWASVTPAVGNRHTAVFDIYHDRMHFITGTTTNWSQTASDTIGTIAKGCTQPLALFAYMDGATRPIASAAYAKIYRCKIYEKDVLVHNFEPCKKDDGTIGFKDLITGSFISNTVYSNNSSYPAAENFIAVGFVPTISPSATRISQRQTAMLTASAPGAASYRWLKNGEVISGGENGTLTVSWRKPKNAPTDTYRAIASYTLTDGQTAESEASASLIAIQQCG